MIADQYFRHVVTAIYYLPFLPCPALSCLVLPCPALSCPVLYCPALSCIVLPCPALFCLVLPSCQLLFAHNIYSGLLQLLFKGTFVTLQDEATFTRYEFF